MLVFVLFSTDIQYIFKIWECVTSVCVCVLMFAFGVGLLLLAAAAPATAPAACC